jgi:hypothetical protein
MNNTAHTFWEKKLPPFSGLVLVAVLMMTISWLTGNVVLFGTKAATEGVPKNVQITNITDTSFTITYQTDAPVLGSIGYGTNDSLGNIGLDDRDQILNKATEHRMHHITIKSLTPGSKYIFEISSGGSKYKNNDAHYEVVTAPSITAQTTPALLKGQVTLDDGTIPIEGIVQITAETSQILTALLKPDGSYEVPLQSLRNRDLAAWTPLTAATELQVTVSTPTQQSTAVLLADQVNPAPLMVLSKNYDFSIDDTQLAATEATGSALPGDLTVPVDTAQVTSPTITTPEKDQSFNDLQPMFEGKALPGSEVTLTIQSQEIVEVVVQSDASGNWQFRPTLPLAPGNHILTIKSPDVQGVLQSVSQPFTVFAQGTQFIEPSISPPPLPTPVQQATPSATPTLLPEPSPTIEPTPTAAFISPAPTISGGFDPNDPNNQNNGTNGNPPVPNSGSSAWLIGLVGIFISAGVGTLLFFFI